MRPKKIQKKTRKKLWKKLKGITLIELVLVIIILGILAVTVLPTFIDATGSAATSSRDGVVGAVKNGLQIYRSNNIVISGGTSSIFPATLDSASNSQASSDNLLFTTVIKDGIDDNAWTKTNSTTYVYSKGGISSTFTYTALSGLFGLESTTTTSTTSTSSSTTTTSTTSTTTTTIPSCKALWEICGSNSECCSSNCFIFFCL